MLGDSWEWCPRYPRQLPWPRHRSGLQSGEHGGTTRALTSLLRRSMTWPGEIFTFGMLIKWSDALVYLWTFYLWTVTLPLCVPRHSAQAAGVPGNNCRTPTMCSLSETHRRFALSWKLSERDCWIKMERPVTSARTGYVFGGNYNVRTWYMHGIYCVYTMYIKKSMNCICRKLKCDIHCIC